MRGVGRVVDPLERKVGQRESGCEEMYAALETSLRLDE